MSTNLLPVQAMVPGANINAYLQAVSAFPILSQEEEQREYLKEMMDQYNMRAVARRFRRWAKLAGDN